MICMVRYGHIDSHVRVAKRGMLAMTYLRDKDGRPIRLTDERLRHLESDHPEMRGQVIRIEQTLREPQHIVRSRSDPQVELFYRLYASTPVTRKHLCVVVKILSVDNAFVVTAYFTDVPKRGEVLWQTR